jgi:hypothetical protein
MLKEDTTVCGKTKGVNRCDGDEMMQEYKEQTTTLVFETCVELRYYGNKPLENERIRRLCHIMILRFWNTRNYERSEGSTNARHTTVTNVNLYSV